MKRPLSILMVVSLLFLTSGFYSLPVLATPVVNDVTNSKDNVIAAPVDWSFVDIANNGTETQMNFNAPINYKSTIDPYANIAADGSGHSASANDIAIVYTAPAKVKIKLKINYSVNPGSNDGVCISVYLNTVDKSFISNKVVAPSETGAPEFDDVVLNAGSKIYIRLNENANQNGDYLSVFHATVTYLEINPLNAESSPGIIPVPGETTKMTNNITAIPKNWMFQAISLSTGTAQNMNYFDRPEYKAYGVTDKAPGDPGFDGTDGYALLYNHGGFGTSMNYDIASVFVAPVKAVVNIDVNLSVNNGGDGVKLSVYKNTEDNIISAEELVAAGVTRTLSLTNIFVNAGDKIFVRLNKNEIIDYDAGSFGVTVTYAEVNMPLLYVGETTNSKNNVIATPVDWGFKTIASDGTISNMIWNEIDKKYFVTDEATESNQYAYFGQNGFGHTANTLDTAAVFTAPQKVKIRAEIKYSVNSGSSDGVGLCVTRNETNRYLLSPKILAPGDGTLKTETLDNIILNANDKMHFRINKNVQLPGDTLEFYVVITYLEINPTGEANEGVVVDDRYKVGDKSESYRGIAEDTGDWSFKAVKLSDNTVHNMVYTTGTDMNAYRVTTNSASSNYTGLFGSNYSVGTAPDYDVMTVFTAPIKAKITITVTSKLSSTSDGILLSVSRNGLSELLLQPKVLRYSDGIKDTTLTDIVVNKEDMLYFRVNKRDNVANDYASFGVQITYNEINPIGEVTQGMPYTGEVAEVVAVGATSNSVDNVSATEGQNNWNFVYINQSGFVDKMVYNRAKFSYGIPNANEGNSYAQFTNGGAFGAANDYDTAVVYTAPANAKIRFEINASIGDSMSDGVIIKAFRNLFSNRTWPTDARQVMLKPSAGKQTYELELSLAKNEKIYFVLNKNISHNSDSGSFYVGLEFLELYDTPPKGSQTPVADVNSELSVFDVNLLKDNVFDALSVGNDNSQQSVYDNSGSPDTGDNGIIRVLPVVGITFVLLIILPAWRRKSRKYGKDEY